jgi:hypothetical protein
MCQIRVCRRNCCPPFQHSKPGFLKGMPSDFTIFREVNQVAKQAVLIL